MLIREAGTAINDDGFARRIAYNVGVFLERIANKALNVKHCRYIIMIT